MGHPDRSRGLFGRAVFLLLLVCCGRASGQAGNKEECRRFVQGFYGWYTAPVAKDKRHPLGTHDIDEVVLLKSALFESRLFRLLHDDRDAQWHSEDIVGIDFDPFLNSQDPSPHFRVQSVQLTGQGCSAVMWGIEDGKHRETVMPLMKYEGHHWKFENFQYLDEDRSTKSNLITQLQTLKIGRNASRPK